MALGVAQRARSVRLAAIHNVITRFEPDKQGNDKMMEFIRIRSFQRPFAEAEQSARGGEYPCFSLYNLVRQLRVLTYYIFLTGPRNAQQIGARLSKVDHRR